MLSIAYAAVVGVQGTVSLELQILETPRTLQSSVFESEWDVLYTDRSSCPKEWIARRGLTVNTFGSRLRGLHNPCRRAPTGLAVGFRV